MAATSENVPQTFTLEEVSKHNTVEDAWIVIGNKVLDVTEYLEEHPGGPEPLIDCLGKVATQDFEDAGHSSDARGLLKKYCIGKLSKTRRAQTATTQDTLSPPEMETKPRSGSSTSSVKSFLAKHKILEIVDINDNNLVKKRSAGTSSESSGISSGSDVGDLPRYTLEEVAKHNKPTDAWIVIGEKVLDVTAYLEDHPGGPEPVLDVLGTVATQDFEDAGHSSDAYNMLEDFLIGFLSENDLAEETNKNEQMSRSRAKSEPRILYSREEVAKHNTPDDAWIIIGNQICDVTSFMSKHPGGRAIFLDKLGADCTTHFEQAGHSNYANKRVKEFVVGKLDPAQRSAMCSVQ